MKCKQCGKKSQSGHKFCNKKCRKDWIENHPYIKNKGDYLLRRGISGRGQFDHEGNLT